MSFLSRLLGRDSHRGQNSLSGSYAVDLVSGPRPKFKAPRRLDIASVASPKPWSLARLMAIFREANRFPTEGSLRDARYARHCLSCFWLAAPIDLLEEIHAGFAGDVQRELLNGPLPHQDLALEEKTWRQSLSSRLSGDSSCPERWNLLLAAMPYNAPAGMQVDLADLQIPTWLQADYAAFCDPDFKLAIQPPRVLPGTPPEDLPPSQASAALALPKLWPQAAAELVGLFEDPTFLTRQQGLLNLFAIDTSDQDVIEALSCLRRQLGQLWLDVVPAQLEQLYNTQVGEYYRALIESGFGSAPLSPDDQALRAALTPLVADLERPRATHALLAVLPFFPPGRVEFEDTSALPAWLRRELERLTQAS